MQHARPFIRSPSNTLTCTRIVHMRWTLSSVVPPLVQVFLTRDDTPSVTRLAQGTTQTACRSLAPRPGVPGRGGVASLRTLPAASLAALPLASSLAGSAVCVIVDFTTSNVVRWRSPAARVPASSPKLCPGIGAGSVLGVRTPVAVAPIPGHGVRMQSAARGLVPVPSGWYVLGFRTWHGLRERARLRSTLAPFPGRDAVFIGEYADPPSGLDLRSSPLFPQ
jgi:hypothetical protein